MDWKQIDEIHTPETWIENVLEQTEHLEKLSEQEKTAEAQKNPGKNHRRKDCQRVLGTAAGIVLCIVVSLSAAAAVSQDFREWVLQQLFNAGETGADVGEEQVKVTRVSLPEGYDMLEDGFLIACYGTEKETVYRAENGKLIKCEKKHMESSIEVDGKTYDFSFDYAQDEWRIHGYHYDGAVVKVSGYKNQENKAIIWLKTGRLSESYYLELDTGVLSPVVDESELPELMEAVMAASDEATIIYAMEVEVSPEGTYLLYQSNRDWLPTDPSDEYEPTADEDEWFLRNNITGEEIKLEKVPGVLHTNEIGFLDDTHISIASSNDEEVITELEPGVYYIEEGGPGVYDCETGQWTWMEPGPELGTTYYDSLIYDVEGKGEVAYYDMWTKEKYVLSTDNEWEHTYSYVGRDTICLVAEDNTCRVYLVPQKKLLDFGAKTFSDVDFISKVFCLKENMYLFEGKKGDEEIGYLMEIQP